LLRASSGFGCAWRRRPKRLECEFYGANGSICGNPDVTPPSTFCSFHTCKEAGCTNSKASRDKFCLSHTRAASAEVEINFFVAGGARAATPVPAERIYGVVHTFHGMEELKRRRDTYIPYLHWVDDGIAAIIGSDPNVLHKAAGSFSQGGPRMPRCSGAGARLGARLVWSVGSREPAVPARRCAHHCYVPNALTTAGDAFICPFCPVCQQHKLA